MDIFSDEILLENSRAYIRRLTPDDFDLLKNLACEEGTWKFNPVDVHDYDSFRFWMEKLFAAGRDMTCVPFFIADKSVSKPAGSSSFLNISLPDKRLEIGHTWYGNEFRGTGLNKYCKLLLLDFAFSKIGIERVEFKTDMLNLRSRAALKKIGAFEEGTLRSHMQMPGGRRRDSVYYSILRNEWDNIRSTQFAESV